MPLTQEEILAQLRTRGFEKGFQATPLREFTGTLESITGDMVQRGRMAQPRLEVLYNFVDIEVIDTTEPYISPVAQISIMQSTRERSLMGVFGASVDRFINVDSKGNPLPDELPDGTPNPNLKSHGYLIGKVLHIKVTGGHMMWDGNRGEETPREAWELVGMEALPGGAAEVSPGLNATQEALRVLDGKTEQQWHQVVFNNPAVKADEKVRSSILNRTFLDPLEADGVITKDDNGVYHVKKD